MLKIIFKYYKISFSFLFDTGEFPMLNNYSFLVTSLCSHLLPSFKTEQERTMFVSAVLLILPYLFETLYVVVD